MKELVRRSILTLASFALRRRSHPWQPAPDSRCVVIAPHPDDEVFGCAGLILAYRTASLPVEIIYLTDGSGSHPNHPLLQPAAIAALRRREAADATALLQVSADALHFIDAADGSLASLTEEARRSCIRDLGRILASIRPTEVFLPCENDSSTEHNAAFHLVMESLREAGLSPRILEYPIWARWRPQHLFNLRKKSRHIWRQSLPESISIKKSAIATYASQVAPTPPWSSPVLPRGFPQCFTSPEEFFFER